MLLDGLESRLDDLLNCQSLVKEYVAVNDNLNDDISSFSSQVNKVVRNFRAAVSALNTSDQGKHIGASLEAYEKALDGSNEIGKFYRHWKRISTTNVSYSFVCLFACLFFGSFIRPRHAEKFLFM